MRIWKWKEVFGNSKTTAKKTKKQVPGEPMRKEDPELSGGSAREWKSVESQCLKNSWFLNL